MIPQRVRVRFACLRSTCFYSIGFGVCTVKSELISQVRVSLLTEEFACISPEKLNLASRRKSKRQRPGPPLYLREDVSNFGRLKAFTICRLLTPLPKSVRFLIRFIP